MIERQREIGGVIAREIVLEGQTRDGEAVAKARMLAVEFFHDVELLQHVVLGAAPASRGHDEEAAHLVEE